MWRLTWLHTCTCEEFPGCEPSAGQRVTVTWQWQKGFYSSSLYIKLFLFSVLINLSTFRWGHLLNWSGRRKCSVEMYSKSLLTFGLNRQLWFLWFISGTSLSQKLASQVLNFTHRCSNYTFPFGGRLECVAFSQHIDIHPLFFYTFNGLNYFKSLDDGCHCGFLMRWQTEMYNTERKVSPNLCSVTMRHDGDQARLIC